MMASLQRGRHAFLEESENIRSRDCAFWLFCCRSTKQQLIVGNCHRIGVVGRPDHHCSDDSVCVSGAIAEIVKLSCVFCQRQNGETVSDRPTVVDTFRTSKPRLYLSRLGHQSLSLVLLKDHAPFASTSSHSTIFELFVILQYFFKKNHRSLQIITTQNNSILLDTNKLAPVTPKRRWSTSTYAYATMVAHRSLSSAMRSKDDNDWPVNCLIMSLHVPRCSSLATRFRLLFREA